MADAKDGAQKELHHLVPVDPRKRHGDLRIDDPELGAEVVPLTGGFERLKPVPLGIPVKRRGKTDRLFVS